MVLSSGLRWFPGSCEGGAPPQPAHRQLLRGLRRASPTPVGAACPCLGRVFHCLFGTLALSSFLERKGWRGRSPSLLRSLLYGPLFPTTHLEDWKFPPFFFFSQFCVLATNTDSSPSFPLGPWDERARACPPGQVNHLSSLHNVRLQLSGFGICFPPQHSVAKRLSAGSPQGSYFCPGHQAVHSSD